MRISTRGRNNAYKHNPRPKSSAYKHMTWTGDNLETQKLRLMLRGLMTLLEKRKLLYLLPSNVVEWWEGEKPVIAKEQADRAATPW